MNDKITFCYLEFENEKKKSKYFQLKSPIETYSKEKELPNTRQTHFIQIIPKSR